MPQKFSDPPLSPDDVALLDRYHLGLADADEVVRARQLLETHRGERLFAEAVRAELRGVMPVPSPESVQVRFQQLRELLVPQERRSVFTPPAQSSVRRRPWPSLAWAVLGAAAVVAVWAVSLVPRRNAGAGAPLEYATENGERAHVTLPDGNTVFLNVGTRLDVPANYAAGNHVVTLTGEALFNIAHHGKTPLTVVAGGATARVLGTHFVVRHYRTDTTTVVAVRDGKVGVGPAVVTAQRLIEVGSGGRARLRVAKQSLFSFATGVLAIDSVRLADAIPDLNRWYDVEMRLGDSSLAAQQIDGRFAAGSVSGFVEVLEGTYDVHVVRSGRVLTIYAGARR